MNTGGKFIDDYLTGNSPGPYPFGNSPDAGNSLNGGNYIVRVYDNNDDANPVKDSDGRAYVESTGTHGGTQKRIVALMEVISNMPSPLGAAEALGTVTELDAEESTGGAFDGRDWDPPADISACVDTETCGTMLDPSTNPATYGGFTNAPEAKHLVQLSNGGRMVGTGCLPPECDGTDPDGPISDQLNPSVNTDRWDAFIDEMSAKATRNLTINGDWCGAHNRGTAASPEITVINTDGFYWDADVNGAGILIIESAGGDLIGDINDPDKDWGAPKPEGEIRVKGTLNWQGLVIVRSPKSVEFENGLDGGTTRIFGQVVNRSEVYSEIEFENNASFVKYSSTAMKLVKKLAVNGATVVSWREDM